MDHATALMSCPCTQTVCLLQEHGADILDRITAELNESQAQALTSVLRNRVALVQGPPGTGKTFLGCKVKLQN